MSGKRLESNVTAKPTARSAGPADGGSIVIVGVGHMGGAFARGLIAADLGPRLILIDPDMKPADARAFRASGAQTSGTLDPSQGSAPDAIILAVKPQLMAQTVPVYAKAARTALVISIAAGTSIESLRTWLGPSPSIVRAMPNLPAAIGKGICAAFATDGTTPAQKKLAETLLKAVGDMVWLDGEELLNAVTAVSGSGPAYVFLLAEALGTAAERVGLPADIARLLARKTIEGAGALLAQSDSSAADLRKSVTSPGGTTEAAMKILLADSRFETLLSEAVAAATSRGFELDKTR